MCAMNSPNDKISQALRDLATGSPQGASPELGARLNSAFARHHRVRRQKRAALVAGIAAVLALAVMLLRLTQPPSLQVRVPPAPAAIQPVPISPDATQKPAEASTAQASVRSARKKNVGVIRRVPSMPNVPSGDFIALSSFDPAIPLVQGRIVRMELSSSALRMAGFPVDAELMGHRVMTDLLVGQDGRPYAARLVQTRMVH